MLVEFLCVRRLIIFQVLEMQKMQHRIQIKSGKLETWVRHKVPQRAMCTDDIFYFNLPLMFFSDFISLQDL